MIHLQQTLLIMLKMFWFKGALSCVILLLGLSCYGAATSSSDMTSSTPAPSGLKVQGSCKLPTKARFRRTIYRPYSRTRTGNYDAGSVIDHGTVISAICKSDVIGDIITKRTISWCLNGRWWPRLPPCIIKRRCRAPPLVENATPSETISPYQTFPHKTSVTFTCNAGKMATGNGTIVCDNGRWSRTNLNCKDDPDMVQAEKCLNTSVMNGRISAKSVADGIYDVTCNDGYRVVTKKMYKCKGGIWSEGMPRCVRAAAMCRVNSHAKRWSHFRFASNGSVVKQISIRHSTELVQMCKKQPTIRRKVKCLNGRWVPTLMTCNSNNTGRLHHRARTNRNHLLNRGLKTADRIRKRRSSSTCIIPKLKGGPSNFTTSGGSTSGGSTSLQVNAPVPHGHEVLRECVDGGFMLLPGVLFTTTFTSKCHNGNWTPEFPRCLRDIKDTVFYDDIIEETTKQTTLQTTNTEQATSTSDTTTTTTPDTTTPTTSVTTTTPIPNVEYRIHLQKKGEHSHVFLFINEPDQGFFVDLFDNEVSIQARNVGTISRTRFASTDDWEHASLSPPSGVNFVSIYMQATGSDTDSDKFYIEKYAGGQETRSSPCAMSFKSFPAHAPDYDNINWEEDEYRNEKMDEISCKIKCIEYGKFVCKTSYYHKKVGLCTVFNRTIAIVDAHNQDLVILKRDDACN
ncbi:uncharacterized protein LOC132717774 isoform X2 [Ruditapes philippinarum]|uniref:uncharacterized protein LOC132717774 isoform X2 n=1 Tax=Ruditapes philippinarum TaxID=129788 RepID=UPI00295BB11B|nr:uncharacterized protein LOC132717774 isoform X2 [Ruditapes philippinarum]